MKQLFEDTLFGKLKLKNRLVRSARGENLATAEGHIPQDLFNIYKELAEGGVGMIITSFTSVAPVDHFNEGLLRLHNDSLIPEYKTMVDEIHKHGCIVMPQLALGIYQRQDRDGNYHPVEVPDMNTDDIQEVIRKFVSAAVRAKQAGFDGIQLHGCHGFVLNRFSSPNNFRQDEYGYTLAGRSKIYTDIIRGIRNIAGNLHISIKVNGGDMPAEELIQFCILLAESGLDSIEYEGYFTQTVTLLQKQTALPVILTGGLRKIETLNVLLNQKEVAYFGMARPLIREAGLPNRWRNGDMRPSSCRSCGLCMTTYGFRCALK